MKVRICTTFANKLDIEVERIPDLLEKKKSKTAPGLKLEAKCSS